ncbi:MAG: HAD hydrolase family protein [Phycisphaerae bacterium]|nr:HAD hydrolase family protein [Phycisphaerae bacterium]
MSERKIDLEKIRLLVLDVDGVLTDGSIIINADGSESKSFNTLDGHGIKMWQRSGAKVAFLSGRQSEPTQKRADQLGVDFCFQDIHVKFPVLEDLCKQLDIGLENVAYIGDDLPDLPIILRVGFGVCVFNAPQEIKNRADYVTSVPGGSGAVREVIEHILKNTGKWDELMQRYEN